MNSTLSTIPSNTFAHPHVQYCAVAHRGELLKKKLKDNKISVTEASLKYGYASRNSMYHQFTLADADIRLFIFISKTYGIDFSADIPEFREEFMKDLLSGGGGELGIMTVAAHLNKMDEIKSKLIEVMEVNRILTEENNRMKHQLYLASQKQLPPGKS